MVRLFGGRRPRGPDRIGRAAADARRRGGLALSGGSQQGDQCVAVGPAAETPRDGSGRGDRPAWFERSAADLIDAGVAAAALESLPIEQREVVVARIWGGLTFQQIGQLVGVSDSAAHRRYEAALVGLAPEIEGAMSEERLNDELAAIEAALGSLTPAASGIRTRPADVSGGTGLRRIGHPPTSPVRLAALLWPIATAASLLAAATFGILWAAGNKPEARRTRPPTFWLPSSPMTIDFPSRHIAAVAVGEPAFVPVGAGKGHRRVAGIEQPSRLRPCHSCPAKRPIVVCSNNSSTTQPVDDRRFP